MSVSEAVGRALGALAAPAAFVGSLVRGARLFHPDGVLYRADVSPLDEDDLARAMAGTALVRLSGALFRYRPDLALPDILGAALRLHPGEAGEQDLLFATFQTVPELPFAVFSTDTRDFLANTYSTVLPSRAPGLGFVDFRLVPELAAEGPGDRRVRLERAVRADRAAFTLEARRRDGSRGTDRLARITLRTRVEGGGQDLRFNPFHAGLGIEPVGFFQALRVAVYPASQLGRSLVPPARRPGTARPPVREDRPIDPTLS